MSDSPSPPPKPPKPSRASLEPVSLSLSSSSSSAASYDDNHPINPELSSAASSYVDDEHHGDVDRLTYEVSAVKMSEKSLMGVDDILAADAEDESLRKYKEMLLGGAAHGDRGDVNDPRRLIITEYRVIFAAEENLPDIIHHLDTPAGVQRLSSEGISLREGSKFKFRITFKVQHDLIIAIKFVNRLSKLLYSDTEELVLGSYPPSSNPQVFEFPRFDYNEAPRGMLFRGDYKATNVFIDGDGKHHLSIEYTVHIVK